MHTRPKAVTRVIWLYGAAATLLIFATLLQAIYILMVPQWPFRLLAVLGALVVYASVSLGLRRMKPWARHAGLWLSLIQTAWMIAAMALSPDFETADMDFAGWAGYFTGGIILVLILLYPFR